jgi:hypothetical protein
VQLDPLLLLPLLFKLFRVNDKALREMLFRHIIAGKGVDRVEASPSVRGLGWGGVEGLGFL